MGEIARESARALPRRTRPGWRSKGALHPTLVCLLPRMVCVVAFKLQPQPCQWSVPRARKTRRLPVVHCCLAGLKQTRAGREGGGGSGGTGKDDRGVPVVGTLAHDDALSSPQSGRPCGQGHAVTRTDDSPWAGWRRRELGGRRRRFRRQGGGADRGVPVVGTLPVAARQTRHGDAGANPRPGAPGPA